MTHNQVIIYSNGIADFQRRYAVNHQSPTAISIPVKQDHIGDVLGSLNVYGDVAIDAPPSFRPANETEGPLSLDPGNVLEQLAHSLCGARLRVERGNGELTGVLAGLHSEDKGEDGVRVELKHLLVQGGDGFEKIPFRDVVRLRFEDASVQAEIDKALQRSFQRIKPQSTFVDLTLSSEQDDAEAIVQYAVPAAAWKMSYRLRQQEDSSWELLGFAIVDNNTEEDWNDFLVSVVAGEPITFSTDLADSKTPRRRHVNVVNEMALGAVEIEESMEVMAFAAEASSDSIAPGDVKRRKMARMASPAVMASGHGVSAARMEEAEVREVGLCVFQSQRPVSIDAGKSAVIPMFNAGLERAKTVLHYQYQNHAERPFRAVEFLNETDYSLGRGVCTVFQGGAYAGSCVIPATKPRGEQLLAHALETGVVVRRDEKREKRRLVGLRLSKGFGHISHHVLRVTEYRFKNNNRQPSEVILDHTFLLDDPTVDCQLRRADEETALTLDSSLKRGGRVRFSLAPEEQLLVRWSESKVTESASRLVDFGRGQESYDIVWLMNNVVQTNGPLAQEPAVRQCLEIQQRLDAKQQEIDSASSEVERLSKRQERLRKNIQTGGHDEQTRKWKTDLGAAEQRIVTLEDNVLPQRKAEKASIEDELRVALRQLDAAWRE